MGLRHGLDEAGVGGAELLLQVVRYPVLAPYCIRIVDLVYRGGAQRAACVRECLISQAV